MVNWIIYTPKDTYHPTIAWITVYIIKSHTQIYVLEVWKTHILVKLYSRGNTRRPQATIPTTNVLIAIKVFQARRCIITAAAGKAMAIFFKRGVYIYCLVFTKPRLNPARKYTIGNYLDGSSVDNFLPCCFP